MDDMLYDVAYATCYDDDDLRSLAQDFEAMNSEWKTDHARRIYRRLGDRDKYLELRAQRLEYGADYHDLATFYWDSGEKEKALQVAEDGLRQAQGRMDELRAFVAARAEETGDREKYMALQYDQTIDVLTFEKYKAFKELCSAKEWCLFEPQLLLQLQHAGEDHRLKIRMHRQEYDEALAILTKGRYPMSSWGGEYHIQVAQELEKRYPEQILKYYLSGLGHLGRNADRKEYTRKAKVMVKVRHVLVDVLGDKARWEKFARQVKRDNLRRPAFQQEFAHAVPGWRELLG
jgi:tetratricopeptide (TPR) repeat protein